MVNLLPEDALNKLKSRFGERFENLNQIKRIALVIASLDGSINHARLKEVSMLHPHDLSKELKELVDDGFLEPHGATTGRIYFLPVMTIQKKLDSPYEKLDKTKESSVHLDMSSVHLGSNPVHLGTNSEQLKEIANEISSTKGAPKEKVVKVILKLCDNRFLTVQEIAQLLNRDPSTIRTHYINWLVQEGYLKIRYPSRSHPNQAYTTKQTET